MVVILFVGSNTAVINYVDWISSEVWVDGRGRVEDS